MNPALRLIRLYPAAFRQRWGADLELEVQHAGRAAWANLAVSVAGMWLRPAIWPVDSPVQRRQRMATMAVVLAAACWFLTHAAMELDAPRSLAGAHTWPMNACAIVMMLGLVLVVPRPRPTLDAALTLLHRAACGFAVPAILTAVVTAAVQTGAYTAAPALLRPILLICWWTALALGAIQSCRIVASLGAATAVPPSPARLRLGLWCLAAAGTLPGLILLGTSVSSEQPHLLSAASGASLLVLSPAFVGTLRDLRRLSSGG
ncbi:hypothetical protein Psi02_36930 [Planotetraspora silvatica]|uniref:Uncharacterized protein n=1 Tax=Planotetraspora silvatica TaxID=234614 RepID=A0A8J3XN92_9ACTN|nr:hypothetical protein [Planotetraspora silvatica]GII47269.1 hypothetical protein Psi02_36930 [Planotetraspora silvatica]